MIYTIIIFISIICGVMIILDMVFKCLRKYFNINKNDKEKQVSKKIKVLWIFFESLSGIISLLLLCITLLQISLPEPILSVDTNTSDVDHLVNEFYFENPSCAYTIYYKFENPDTKKKNEFDTYKEDEKIRIEKSGYITYFVKSCLKETKPCRTYIKSYEDSVKDAETQDGELSNNLTELAYIPEYIGEENRFVSQQHMATEEAFPLNLTCGWGDTSDSGGRKTYSLKELNENVLGNNIVFNSIVDSEGALHDERNFVSARIDNGSHGKNNVWHDYLDVNPGEEYIIRLYGHNNSPLARKAIANDVKAQFMIPEESGRTIAVHGMLYSSNANPDRYWDGVVFTSKKKFHLEVVDGSPFIESNSETVGGRKLPMSIVNDWCYVGFDDLDGDIPGCYYYAFYLAVKVKIVEDK